MYYLPKRHFNFKKLHYVFIVFLFMTSRPSVETGESDVHCIAERQGYFLWLKMQLGITITGSAARHHLHPLCFNMSVRVAFVPDNTVSALTHLKTFLVCFWVCFWVCFCQMTQNERLECQLLPLLCLFIELTQTLPPLVISLLQKAVPSTWALFHFLWMWECGLKWRMRWGQCSQNFSAMMLWILVWFQLLH